MTNIELCPACWSEMEIRYDNNTPFYYCRNCGEDYDMEDDK